MLDKVLLTGRPGVGKTTVVRRTVAAGLVLAGGFVTEEVRRAGRRVGFKVTDLFTGREGTLAHAERKGRPRVGKYGVDLACFEAIGVVALHEALSRPGCIVIDEIGKMELCSSAFQSAVMEVFESGQPILATIPGHSHPLLDRLRSRDEVTVIEVTTSNREALPAELVQRLGGRQ